ncbi:alpha/beta hydrolase-fold protein [Sorangium sp. So ce726]|uniref:esterase family protein n=1 Tax=Sorangium sp. So ce726 TaxID=3133319 RepID=UPI003F63B3DD
MQRSHHKWYSPRLGQDMELLVFGHKGARVLVFPTRCGRFFDYADFGMLEAVRERVENGWLQLYCVDSVDGQSFYCLAARPYDRIRRHQAYEDYLLHEVLPLSEQLNAGSFLISHGCSLGAYHAVNIALRHPHLFGKAVAFSGRFDLTEAVDDFKSLLEGHFEDLVYFHMPTMFLPNIREEAVLSHLRRLRVELVIGEHDPFLASNQRLAAAMANRGIPHQLHVWQNRAHNKHAWAKMAHLYL